MGTRSDGLKGLQTGPAPEKQGPGRHTKVAEKYFWKLLEMAGTMTTALGQVPGQEKPGSKNKAPQVPGQKKPGTYSGPAEVPGWKKPGTLLRGLQHRARPVRKDPELFYGRERGCWTGPCGKHIVCIQRRGGGGVRDWALRLGAAVHGIPDHVR